MTVTSELATPVKIEDHIGLAHAIASQFVHNRTKIKDTEEYAEACLQLVEAINDYRPEDGTFSAFAWQKMKNRLIDMKRWKGRKKRQVIFEKKNLRNIAFKDAEPKEEDFSMFDLLAGADNESDDERADKLLLIEVYLGGVKVPEIAERIGVTRESIYQRMRRASKRLREKFD